MVTLEISDAEERALLDGALRAFKVGRGTIELSDLNQEAFLWAYEHPHKVIEWREQDDSNNALRVASYHAGLAYVRSSQRALTGARKPDQSTYSEQMVLDLLPAIWDYEAWTGGGDHDESDYRPPTKPNEGNTHLALLIDVKAAVSKLTPEQQFILSMLHKDGMSYDDVCLLLEPQVSSSTIRRREQRAVEAIVDLLGGPAVVYKRKGR